RHTRCLSDWSSDVCSSDLYADGFHLRAPRLPYPLNLLAALFGARNLAFSEALAAMRFLISLRLGNFRVLPDCSVSRLLDEHAQRSEERRVGKDGGSRCASA